MENKLHGFAGKAGRSAKEVPKKLALKLKAIRLHLGFTMEQMAEAVGKKGRSRRTRVYEWEKKGTCQPDLACLLTYARLTSVSTDALIDDESELKLEMWCSTKDQL